MKILADRCVSNRSPATSDRDDDVIADCQAAISAPIRCSYPPSSRRTGATVTGRVPYPLWLRWDVPHDMVDTPQLLAKVQANLEPYAQECQVAYAQSRLVHGDLARGRAKLIVVLAPGHRDTAEVQRMLTDVADQAQERTLKQLQAGHDIEPGRVQLRISPRERWIAHSRIST
jgi:hypothetical protein